MPESESLPEDPEKRESMKTMAAAAMGVALFTDASWWPFGDDSGMEEALRILNNGEPVDDGVEELDFGNAISVQKTESGVQIDVSQDFSGDVTTNGAVGIGTRSPGDVAGGAFGAGAVRAAISESGVQRFVGEAFVDSINDAVQWSGVTYRGSKSSPSSVGDQDLLLNISAHGYDGNDLGGGGAFEFRVDGAVSDNVVPTKARLKLTDASGATFVHSQYLPDGTLRAENGPFQSIAGGATYGNGALELGSNGARLEFNASGEVVVIDEAGNETLLS